jgi:hypothetical protein
MKGGRTKPLARQRRLWQVVRAGLHRAHFANKDTESVVSGLIKSTQRLPRELYKSFTAIARSLKSIDSGLPNDPSSLFRQIK